MYFFKFLVGDMSIDLRGSDVRMPQEFLNGPKIRSVYKEIGREAVAELVRMDFFGDAGRSRPPIHQSLNSSGRDPAQNFFVVLIQTYKERRFSIGSL